jgi:hybrid cluster-associated redox disulfide protein
MVIIQTMEEKSMKITKKMTIGEVVRDYSNSINILFGFGLGCVGCPSAQAETIEEACMVHGIDVEQLINALNAAIA